MFLLNSQSSDVCIPWAFDILLLENSQKIDVLIYRMFDISLKPEHCLLLADHNLLLSSQVFKRENEPENVYISPSLKIYKNLSGIKTGKWTCDFFTFYHLWKSIKICTSMREEFAMHLITSWIELKAVWSQITQYTSWMNHAINFVITSIKTMCCDNCMLFEQWVRFSQKCKFIYIEFKNYFASANWSLK